ncbi:hypothetical protein B0F90DRAFT_1736884 [Multifurca ochricompacta]|uniref:Uncharacterized protein n=1 Tax=Multifurca ochricompacta TaxID=376703 RepID=A0AAD4QM12_9AGAM|nr:hypothetical protein B0F90DRAFT_1736884 [Multifurca ochricompacta]
MGQTVSAKRRRRRSQQPFQLTINRIVTFEPPQEVPNPGLATSIESPPSYNTTSTFKAVSDSPFSAISSPFSAISSPYSFYTAIPRLTHQQAALRSAQHRKNVLYPRRARGPLSLPPDSKYNQIHGIPVEMLLSRVHFLCSSQIPHGEDRLIPAGMVLLQASRIEIESNLRDIYDGPSVLEIMGDENLLCCQLFLCVYREIIVRNALGVGEFTGPCSLMKKTFEDILFQRGVFSPRNNPDMEGSLSSRAAELQRLGQLTCMLQMLIFVLDTFESVLNGITFPFPGKTPGASEESSLRDYYQSVLLQFAAPTGLTVEEYRKRLGQELAQAHDQLNGFLRQGPSAPTRAILSPFRSETPPPVLHPYMGVPHEISTIEEGSEDDALSQMNIPFI